jgi:hypothetical protein
LQAIGAYADFLIAHHSLSMAALGAIPGAAPIYQFGDYSTAARKPGKSGSDLIT